VPTLALRTTAPPDALFDALLAAGEEEGFVTDEDDGDFAVIRKGSLTSSILLGPLVVYARAEAEVRELKGGEARLALKRATQWWQGVFGPGRTRAAFDALADRVERRLEKAGFEVLGRKVK
jgi:hypothetical protein